MINFTFFVEAESAVILLQKFKFYGSIDQRYLCLFIIIPDRDEFLILVSGGTGFVGSHVVKDLLTAGFTVWVVTRFPGKYRQSEISGRLKYVEPNFSQLKIALEGELIQGFVHAATNYGLDINSAGAESVFDTNFLFARDFFELAEYVSSPIFINLDSSFSKHRFNRKRLKNYADSKVKFLDFLRFAEKTRSIVNLQLEHVYGPGDSRTKFIPATALSLINNEPQMFFTPGLQVRDFVYVADVSQLVSKFLHDGSLMLPGFTSYEVGSGIGTELKKFVTTMKKLSSSRSSLFFGALSYEENEIMHSVADISKLLDLNWQPNYSIEFGISILLSSLKN